MKEIVWNRVIKALLVVAAVCTTAYLLMLGWFNTLSLDDYGFVVNMTRYTPWKWAVLQYVAWSGRFSNYFISGCMFKIWNNSDMLFSWTIILLLIGYSITYLYMRDVLKVKEVVNRCAIAVLISNITIMSVFEISTFYWLCCAGYFLEIYATLLLFYVLFMSKWKGWVNAIIAIVSAIYISGSAENYTPLVLMILGVIWLVVLIRDTKQSSFKEAFGKHWLLFTICAILGIGFIAMVAAPGNKVRMAYGDGEMTGSMYDFNLATFAKNTVNANVIFMLRVISRSLYWIGVLPIFVYVGKLLKGNKVEMLQMKLWKGIVLATLLLLGFIFIAVTSCVYGFGWYPPLRSMSFVSYAIMVYLAYAGCIIGYKIADKKGQIVYGLAVICAVCWIAFTGYRMGTEYPEVKRYHDYVTQRDDIIQRLVTEGNTETYYVECFEWPKWRNTYSYLRTAINKCVGSKKVVNEPYFPLFSPEVAEAERDFNLMCIKEYYNVEFDIKYRVSN